MVFMYQQCDRNEGCHYIVVFKIQECCRHSYRNSLHSVLHHVGERTVLFLVNKTNRCTEFQFYWYYDSACFGQPFC